MAEWLGLRGGCSVKHKELMIDFLRDINRKGKRAWNSSYQDKGWWG